MHERLSAFRSILAVALIAAALSINACAPQGDTVESGDSWVGTITTDGDVTTVVNESGSVWGGAAELLEEASIGVAEGAEEYMLGDVSGLAMFGTGIAVVDPQVPAVRVYDRAGEYLLDLGREGQGPGEYRVPMEIGSSGGRLFVKDGNRIVEFDRDGGAVSTRTFEKLLPFTMIDRPFLVTNDGVPHAPIVVDVVARDSDTWRWAMLPLTSGQEQREPVPVPERRGPRPLRLEQDGETIGPVPFSHEWIWTFAPTGAVISGNSAEYRYEVDRATGGKLIVERSWEPVAIEVPEAEWYRVLQLERLRQAGVDTAWSGPEIPAGKPAFKRLIADSEDRVWIFRHGPGVRGAECPSLDPADDQAPCWADDELLDAFAADGRFQGPVTLPAGLRSRPHPVFFGDRVWAVVEDEVGTIMVKRYRLVFPGSNSE